MTDIFTPEFDNTVFEVDYNAPESGQFPPAVPPGVYTFLFKLAPKDAFEVGNIPKVNGKPHLKVTIAPEVVGSDGTLTHIAYQTVTTFKTDKMPNHSLGELLRALDIRLDKPTPSLIREALESASGKTTFRATVSWEAYFKDAELTVSTSPRKKRGDLPWPKDENNQFEQAAKNPQTGETKFGREKITNFLLPKGE